MKIWTLAIFGLVLSGQTLPLEKERVLLKSLAGEIRRQSRPLKIPEVEAYLSRLGGRLSAQIPGGEFQFEAIVAEGSEPIGLPGGTIFIPGSFFVAAEDEAEFAGMVAHAMGHAHLRHMLMTRGNSPNGTIPLIFMGGWMGVHADSKQGTALIPAALWDNVRTYELEADRFGSEVAARAGYDGAGLARYLKRVQVDEPTTRSPLPPKSERLAALAAAGTGGGEILGSEFLRVRELVRAALALPVPKAPSL